MTSARSRSRWRRFPRFGVAALAVLALASSCAPRLARPPQLGVEGRAARYHAALAERLARGLGVSANGVMWAERAGERFPGAQGELNVAAPDRMRLRIASAFGTALDLGLAGDSLRAYVPAWKTGLQVDAAESLGVAAAGDRVIRTLCATWEPPCAAWERSVWDDSLVRVGWAEGEDSLHLGVGASGLPAWVELSRQGQETLRASYGGWGRAAGIAWPSLVEVSDGPGSFRLVWRARHVRFEPRLDPGRLAVRWPRDATGLTLADLRAVLTRLGGR